LAFLLSPVAEDVVRLYFFLRAFLISDMCRFIPV
jgi:hypothetical protein